jgi:sec-independent protein translocase protein TatB
MFDIGFSELIVIGIVALVVIGPERLPRVARTLGVLFGRLQRYVTQVKSDINREMDLSEINRVKSEFEGAARSFKQDIEATAAKTEQELRDAQSTIEGQLKTSSTDSVMEPLAPPPGAEPDSAFESSPVAAAPESSPEPLAPTPSPQMELGIEEPEPARDRKAG